MNLALDQLPQTPPLPALFVGHGNPMNAIEDTPFSRGWAEAGKALPTPSAILCVSAHWMTRGSVLVHTQEKPTTIHDFGGFPQELFDQQYPAPGSPQAAAATIELLQHHHAEPDERWGLDHGAWSVFMHMFPKADVPVYQLSLDLSKPWKAHYEMAQELKSLRSRGVMIIGSGNLVHNLRELRFGGQPYDWTVEFDTRMARAIEGRRFGEVVEAERFGNLTRMAHPTPEHFLPLLYILAIADEKDQLAFFNEGYDLGSLSMRSLVFSSESSQ